MRRSVDFGRRSVPYPLAGWALLLVGVIALAAALWTQHRRHEALAQQEALDRQQREREREERLTSAPKPPTARELRLQAALKELPDRTLRMLLALEGVTQAPAGIYLRSLSFEHATRTINLEAEASSFDQALSYVLVLDQDAIFEPAQMLSHEPIVDAFGQPAVTFSASVKWRAR